VAAPVEAKSVTELPSVSLKEEPVVEEIIKRRRN
jgi:hypothetical protein